MLRVGSWTFIVVLAIAIAAAVLLASASGIYFRDDRGLAERISAHMSMSAADYGPPVMVGRIEASDVTESSGLSVSECNDVLWTHNDAGSGPLIFAMDTTGRHLGAWRVEGAKSVDWESIATYRDGFGKCFLLIADFGDNHVSRKSVEIYRISEPLISPENALSSAANPLATAAAQVMRFTYPDGSHDAETLLVHPGSGDIYIVTKERSGPAGVHRIKQQYGLSDVLTTEKVADVSVPSTPEGLLTDGSFSPDGTRLILCDKKGGYEFVLSPGSASVEDIWKQKPVFVDLGDRKQGEGVSYGRDGFTLYASSEMKNAPLYMVKRKSS